MIITRKATVGFILLAIITFITAQYTTPAFTSSPPSAALKNIKFIPPIIDLGIYTPIIITIFMELFALVCYLVLKKLEPRINEVAENFVETFKP